MKLSVQATLNDAFALLRRDASLTLSVAAVFMFVPNVLYFAFIPGAAAPAGELNDAQMGNLLIMGLLVPMIIIGVFTFVGALIVTRIWFQPQGATVGDAIGYGLALVPMAVALHLLISLCSLFGFALLLIPGFIVVTCTVLILPMMADRAVEGPLAAWGEGWKLAQSHFWPLLALVIIAGLMSLAFTAGLGYIDGSWSDQPAAAQPLLSGLVNGMIALFGGMINAAIAAAAYRQIRGPNVREIFS